MLGSKVLKSTIIDKDDARTLRLFRRLTRRYLHIDYPMDYLRSGFVRIFKDASGVIRGGYVVALIGPLRTLSSINAQYLESIKDKKVFEINGLWLDPKLKSGIASCQFWYQVSRDVSSQKGYDYLVYSYDLSKKKLGDLYELSKPIILYQGKVEKLPGMKGEAYESIQLCKPKVVYFLPFYAFPNFISKALFCRKTYAFGRPAKGVSA